MSFKKGDNKAAMRQIIKQCMGSSKKTGKAERATPTDSGRAEKTFGGAEYATARRSAQVRPAKKRG